MAEEKIKRGRGRPKGSGKRVAPVRQGPSTDPTDERSKLELRRAIAAESTRKAWVEARQKRTTLAQEIVSEDHPSLRYLSRENRLAWLALQVHRDHVEEKVISLGPAMGYEIVDTATDAPKFRAMELLMKACGDFSDGVRVGVQVGGGDQGKVPRVALLVMSNGRAPMEGVGAEVENDSVVVGEVAEVGDRDEN